MACVLCYRHFVFLMLYDTTYIYGLVKSSQFVADDHLFHVLCHPFLLFLMERVKLSLSREMFLNFTFKFLYES